MAHNFGPKRYPQAIHWDRQEQKLLACESIKVPGYVEPQSKKGKDSKAQVCGYRTPLATANTNVTSPHPTQPHLQP